MATVSCLIAVLMTSILLGCEGKNARIDFPTTLHELSLVQVWNKVSEVTDVRDQTADLQLFNLRASSIGTVELLSFIFHGVNAQGEAKVYQADMNPRGELNWYSYDSDTVVFSINHPLIYFQELDKVGLATIESGDDGFSIWVEFKAGGVGYNRDYIDIYYLKDGDLTPLKNIIFYSNVPWGTIMVSRSRNLTPYDGGVVTVGTDPIVQQIWFITADIGKATIVEYLDLYAGLCPPQCIDSSA